MNINGEIFKTEEQLIAGRWYAVGFFGSIERDEIDWGGAMLYKYEGDGLWIDEDGNEVLDTLDPLLQLRVPCGAADAYALQP